MLDVSDEEETTRVYFGVLFIPETARFRARILICFGGKLRFSP